MGSIDTSSSWLPTTSIPPPLSAHLLPATKSSNLTLSPATLLERVQCWHINFNSWRGPLSLPQYLRREHHLGQQNLTANGAITYWILTFKDDALPVGSSDRNQGDQVARPILGACETFCVRGLVARDGSVEDVVCHGVGSVFVRDEYRGRGYAGRMMDELALRLNYWQQPSNKPQGFFSVLFSDIGKRFYAKHGWKPMPSTHIILSPVDDSAYSATAEKLALPTVTDLFSNDLASICNEAVAATAQLALQQSKQSGGRPQIAIHPDIEHMAWHHAREEFLLQTLLQRNPLVKGALDPQTGCAAIWTRVYGDTNEANELHILHLHVPVPTSVAEANVNARTSKNESLKRSIAALMLRAQREAQEWDMRAGVELWSPAAITLDAATLLGREGEDLDVIVREKESICSLRWIGGRRAGTTQEQQVNESEQEVDWLANEKFGWC